MQGKLYRPHKYTEDVPGNDLELRIPKQGEKWLDGSKREAIIVRADAHNTAFVMRANNRAGRRSEMRGARANRGKAGPGLSLLTLPTPEFRKAFSLSSRVREAADRVHEYLAAPAAPTNEAAAPFRRVK